ncbi:MAG: hypothetical protein IPL07_20205 [Acidimicrobiaceae bacterium]|nr:hypothetical protein [Acidimicrobiaceae bacterium]
MTTLFNNLRNTVHYFNGQSPTFDDYSSPLHGSTDKATRYTICVKDNGNGTVTRTKPDPAAPSTASPAPAASPPDHACSSSKTTATTR